MFEESEELMKLILLTLVDDDIAYDMSQISEKMGIEIAYKDIGW